MCIRDSYKNSVKEQPGSSAVVQGISSDEQGIGSSGIGYEMCIRDSACCP